MNGERTNKMGFRSGGLIVAGLALVVAVFPLVTGCESDADSNTLLTPDATTAYQGMSPPTLAELTAGAGLNQSQGRLIAPALTRWREQAGTMDQRRQGRRFGPGPDGFGGQEPPMHAFLQDCATSLDTEQFVAVVNYLADRREAHRATMQEARAERRAQRQAQRQDLCDGTGIHRGDGPGFHRGSRRGFRGDGPGAGMRGFLADLELTQDQHTVLRDAMRTTHQTLREMHRAYADGDLDANGMKARAQGAVDVLRTALQQELNEDQFQAVVAKTRERAQDMANRRLEHMDDMGDRRHDFLVSILDLDENQVAGLEQVRTETRSRMQTLLNRIATGNVAFAEAVYEGIVIHEDRDDAIRALLGEDQIARLDALDKLRRGGGPRMMGIYL